MRKKGVSEIVTTVIMVGLVIAAAAIIWGVVNGMINEKMKDSKNCMDVFEKVTIYPRATCYDASGGGKFYFYIQTTDINATKIIVSIGSKDGSKIVEIPNEKGYEDVWESGEVKNTKISALGSNSGKKYVYKTTYKPDFISVAPKVGNTQCSISDQLDWIDDC